MLRFPRIPACFQPLHPGGDMTGFIDHMVEDGVGGDDPYGTEQDESENEDSAAPLQEFGDSALGNGSLDGFSRRLFTGPPPRGGLRQAILPRVSV